MNSEALANQRDVVGRLTRSLRSIDPSRCPCCMSVPVTINAATPGETAQPEGDVQWRS
jgi:hypothetical protein